MEKTLRCNCHDGGDEPHGRGDIGYRRALISNHHVRFWSRRGEGSYMAIKIAGGNPPLSIFNIVTPSKPKESRNLWVVHLRVRFSPLFLDCGSL